ncbi:hypothetical protein [Massilia litorea]|uniref:Uncharacterized protein n=1 Tax=Massilia litorea TaxID=2769491 RepID=A0A7L9U285_9BURK|nr:hypothetical protein [Massilia litorea]QOL48539.1 hypothetical protein LPB04_16430 [Massilia litorea]
MSIYRAIPRATFEAGKELRRNPGRRLPSVIPYLVDNLWEYARPDGQPSRRHAVYASPTPQLALQNAAAGALRQDDYLACRLTFHYQPAMIQLSTSDARHHPDVRQLQHLVNSRLREWAAGGLGDKLALAPLFMPGVTRGELAAAMAAEPALAKVVEEAAAAVTLWSPAPGAVSPDGELFFEIADDNFYVLHPV